MKQQLPEKYRLTQSRHASMQAALTTAADGANGVFIIPHHRIADYKYTVVISDRNGWDHVSVTLSCNKRDVKRCPTWEEMCYIKELFFDETEYVIQIHPAKGDYVNDHQWCLHLWKCTDRDFPKPPTIMV